MLALPLSTANKPKFFRPIETKSTTHLGSSHSLSFPLVTHSRRKPFLTLTRKAPLFVVKPIAALKIDNEDFVSRVLRENPSQLEPKRLLKRGSDSGLLEFLRKTRTTGGTESERVESGEEKDSVYFKDILREHEGELYVPEQAFRENLSEEVNFDRRFGSLPRMELDEFLKHLDSDKVKLLTMKENARMFIGLWDIIVELKEIPGDKSLHRTEWAISLNKRQAQAVLEQYTGQRYEIEKQITSLVGKLPECPHPVAISISSRMIVEFGMLIAVMATVPAAVVVRFLSLVVFPVTNFIFVVTRNVVWPVLKPFIKSFHGLFLGLLESMWEKIVAIFAYGGIFHKWDKIGDNFHDKIVDIFADDGEILSKLLYEARTLWGSGSIQMIISIFMVPLFLAVVVRFALSRRPKKLKNRDLWQMIEFAQSKSHARVVDGSTGVTFSDVAGIDEAVEELQELVRYLKNPDLFDKMGIKPPHGVLLEGPPGCGKTLIAKAIAGEAGVPFYEMAGSEFVENLVGVGSARVRDLFKRAKVNKPSVVFIDEIDALAMRRQETVGDFTPFTQERETTLNQLLIELDGFDTGKGVIVMGATNRRDLLDPALLRPGRMDRKILIRPPNAKGRLDVLKVHGRKVKLSNTVDLSKYAQNLQGWTGAKLSQLLQEAALVAVRKGHESIFQSDVDDAVDRLTVGPKRVGIELGHQGQSRRATTEVGIALTAHMLRQLENAKVESCERISITPRGQTLSQAVFNRLDDESYLFERKPQLLHRLQVFLGARAAEEVIFGRDTSKASVSYLADASWLARKIVTVWNLENPMVIHGQPPPWRKENKMVGPRFDFEGSLYNDDGLVGPPSNFNLDDDVAKRTEELMRQNYGKTLGLLRRHHAALLKSVKVLLNKKEIRGEEIDFILRAYPQHTPTSCILEEEDPGTLPSFKEAESREAS